MKGMFADDIKKAKGDCKNLPAFAGHVETHEAVTWPELLQQLPFRVISREPKLVRGGPLLALL